MNVVIRADSSSTIGGGHIGRCLALGDILRRRGAKVCFASRLSAGHTTAAITARGFELLPMTAIAPLTPDGEALDFLQCLAGQPCDWLVVDHYGLDAAFESRVADTLKARLLVFDDLADRRHHCDMLTDAGRRPGTTDYAALVDARTVLLAGADFALLRREFLDARPRAPRDAMDPAVLVFYSSADRSGMTAKTLDAIARLGDCGWRFDVVLPASNETVASLRERAEQLKGVTTYTQVHNMAERLINCGLVLGGGGLSLWERCCLGLPSLTVELADNQKQAIETAVAANATRLVGKANELTPGQIADALDAALRDAPGRRAMAGQAWHLVDGCGGDRIADAMMQNLSHVRGSI